MQSTRAAGPDSRRLSVHASGGPAGAALGAFHCGRSWAQEDPTAYIRF